MSTNRKSLRQIAMNRRGFLAAVGVVGVGAAVAPAIASADVTTNAAWGNPTLGTITAHYKAPNYPSHLGTDVANSTGTAIHAANAGSVAAIATGRKHGDKSNNGVLVGRTGNAVLINHASGYRTYYGHLNTVGVSKGQSVSSGQVIGTMGQTGNATGPHLHFEVHLNAVTTNPYTFMSGKGITLGKTSPIGGAGWPTLKNGSSGNTVRVLQHFMNARGYALVVDGAFGSVTVGKVKAFQKAKGLVQDGIVGPVTWPYLIYTVKNGTTGNPAKAAQQALNIHGYGLLVDGNFGSVSVAAAKAFQKKKGLVQDGILGPVSWPHLI